MSVSRRGSSRWWRWTARPCPRPAFANGHPAAVNVGIRPTFETGRGLLIESYLIDFRGDLYGQNLRVAFVERLRGERRFDSAERLIEAMKEDVERARAICATYRQ